MTVVCAHLMKRRLRDLQLLYVEVHFTMTL